MFRPRQGRLPFGVQRNRQSKIKAGIVQQPPERKCPGQFSQPSCQLIGCIGITNIVLPILAQSPGLEMVFRRTKDPPRHTLDHRPRAVRRRGSAYHGRGDCQDGVAATDLQIPGRLTRRLTLSPTVTSASRLPLAARQTRSHLTPGAGGVSKAVALPLLAFGPSVAALLAAPPPQATTSIAKAIRRTSVFMLDSPQRSHVLQARVGQANQADVQLVGY